MSVTALRSIYQIKITLQHTKPPIWRRLLVPTGIKLDQLHAIVQTAMGWSDSHLHQFMYRGEAYGYPDPDCPSNCIDETAVRIEDLLEREKSLLLYEYDFGDDWLHEIVLEKILPFTKETALPVCIDGAGACRSLQERTVIRVRARAVRFMGSRWVSAPRTAFQA